MSANVPPRPGLAYQQTVKRFGAGVRLQPTYLTFTVANSPRPVLINDPDRIFWIIMNRSPYHLEIGFDDSFTLGTAILLPPNGGAAVMTVDEDGEAVTYPVWIASPVAPFTVYLAVISHA